MNTLFIIRGPPPQKSNFSLAWSILHKETRHENKIYEKIQVSIFTLLIMIAAHPLIYDCSAEKRDIVLTGQIHDGRMLIFQTPFVSIGMLKNTV